MDVYLYERRVWVMYDFIKNNEEHEEARKIEMSKLVEFLEKKGLRSLIRVLEEETKNIQQAEN